MRRHHLALVLDLLLRGPRSRAAIADETGLTKGTVSALVGELCERGLAEERDAPRLGTVGRPGTTVAAVPTGVVALGLQVDVDAVAASVVDLAGRVHAVHRHATDNRAATGAEIAAGLRRVARQAQRSGAATGRHLVGGALALPGLVDPAGATLFVAPNLHWFDADLGSLVGRLRLPADLTITADNEANLAALGEARFGAGRDRASFVYVSGGVGVGAALVVDGRVARGAHGFAGELGHVVVDPDGPACACGARGCLEAIVGRDRRAGPGRDRMASTAAAMAAALRTVVHLLDPEAIVLGGTFATLGRDFASDVERRLSSSTLGARWFPCPVLPAVLGLDAPLIGAATAGLDAVLSDPTVVPRIAAPLSTRSAP